MNARGGYRGGMTVPELVGTPDIPGTDFASSNRVLILGPSLGTDTHLWDLAAPALREHYAILRWDLPGHGASPSARDGFTLSELADAVVKLADSYGISTFYHAGVSIAGATGILLAAHYSDKLQGVGVVCSAAKFGEPAMWDERAAGIRANGTASMVATTMGRWFTPEFIQKAPETVKAVMQMLADANDEDYAKLCEALGSYDARPELAGIRVPVLVISGAEDPGATPEMGKAVADAIPGAKQIVIPGASHQAATEKPLEVAKDLIDFFEK